MHNHLIEKEHYIGRFAPTPSGPLHFGSLIAALGSFLDARAHNGIWLLRIEDVDHERCKRTYVSAIKKALEAFSLYWDGEIRTQSEHLTDYMAALSRLKTRLYPCHCSRKIWQKEAYMGALGPIYPGHCRKRKLTNLSPTDCAIRLTLPRETITFHDRWLGEQQFQLQTDIGDPILRRRDGDIAYALAVTVDDAYQGITDVIRGQDLTAATAIQHHLQTLLNYPHPRYLHLPLARDTQGRKLSKQNHAQALDLSDPIPALRQALVFLGMHRTGLSTISDARDLLSMALEEWHDIVHQKNNINQIVTNRY